MVWDFSTEPEFQAQLDWVDAFVRDECEPLDVLFPGAAKSRDPKLRAIVDPLKRQVQDRAMWGLFLDEDLGGPGFGQLQLALLNEILGRSESAPVIFGTQGPDTGNMEILAAYGTDEQKDRWLWPLFRQEIWSAFSMTEPEGGSDPSQFRTRAVLHGGAWVIDGEKWFTSFGRSADILLVMCTNGIFVVPAGTPGVEFLPSPSMHDHVRYTGVRVPLDHLLGPEGGGRVLAQRRLGGGRIGKVIAEHQSVQNAIADSNAEINMLRLLVLWTAWTIDNSDTRTARTQITACKYTCAKVLRDVTFAPVHIFGSLGVTHLTPLLDQWTGVPTQSIMDGPDEVHRVTVARHVLRNHTRHEGVWPTSYAPTRFASAREKYAGVLAADPELAAAADAVERDLFARG